MKLSHIQGDYSILKILPNSPIPDWALQSDFFSISKTPDELSIVCKSECVPVDMDANKSWALLKVLGPLDFSLTGVLNSITNPLAQEKISIFAVSTFDTDYLLVKQSEVQNSKACLEKAGFEFID
ncbi:MAG: ACT domain-containing protein [Bdellovibrionota bacterium]|nr:ACT domain-containing protein [Bdellovibrionota bacterium]